jgi:hypothetical protein
MTSIGQNDAFQLPLQSSNPFTNTHGRTLSTQKAEEQIASVQGLSLAQGLQPSKLMGNNNNTSHHAGVSNASDSSGITSTSYYDAVHRQGKMAEAHFLASQQWQKTQQG